jgi:flagellar protein FliL
MKLVIIGIVAVLLFGGGAGGAYFYFAKPAEAAGGPMDEAAKAEHAAKEAEAAAAPTQEFVQLDALIFPVIGETGVTQTVSLVVSIEVPTKEAAAEVERLAPRLKDAFIQDMYGALNRKDSMEKGVLKVAPLKARLNRVSVKVLGEEMVKDVLLQVIQQRRV